MADGPLDRGEPWWVEAAVKLIDQWLEINPAVEYAFEWGAGASTLWLAERVRNLITVEHDPGWHRQVVDRLAEARPATDRVVVLHIPSQDNWNAYVAAMDRYPELQFGFVAIDGRQRVRCARHAISRMAPGAMLVLDNSERPEYAPIWELTKVWTRVDFYKGPHAGFPEGWGTTVWFKPRS